MYHRVTTIALLTTIADAAEGIAAYSLSLGLNIGFGLNMLGEVLSR